MRKLIACLACRNGGSRLFGKPCQNLDVSNRISVLDHMINMFKNIKSIDSIVLGISNGNENLNFVDIANKHNIKYIFGSEDSVFERLIRCCKHMRGTDIFRVTTESPFTYFETIDKVWNEHIKNDNDITIIDDMVVPEGTHFEIIKYSAFQYADKYGGPEHKRDFCTLYFKQNIEKFKFQKISVPDELKRISDIRLTIDNPEDLALCRSVYSELKHFAPLIPLKEIIKFLDNNELIKKSVNKYISNRGFWDI